jgi:4-hydroxy-tetrahydrodipicolinate reductase
MQRVIIVGAGGKMGRRLVALTAADPELRLVAAIDVAPALQGQDAGVLAGLNPLQVAISKDFAAAARQADVAIDFSAATGLPARLAEARAANCAYVLGTTGLTDEQKAEVKAAAEAGARIVFAPNMSVGVNLLFNLCAKVARILGEDYDIEVVEMHHNQKKDSPSGTAERLGEILAQARELDYAAHTRHGRQGLVGPRTKREIGMHAVRGGDVVGDHTVIFATNGERVELTHKASSRDTFAKGALRAAKFLATARPGLYDMQDVLGLR